jgi:hypothetical protein
MTLRKGAKFNLDDLRQKSIRWGLILDLLTLPALLIDVQWPSDVQWACALHTTLFDRCRERAECWVCSPCFAFWASGLGFGLLLALFWPVSLTRQPNVTRQVKVKRFSV